MPYLYDSHLGGIYSTDELLDIDNLYCDECGDSDWEIGYYEDLSDLWQLVKDGTSIFGTGGYALSHITTFFCDKPREELEEMTDLELLALIEKAINNEETS